MDYLLSLEKRMYKSEKDARREANSAREEPLLRCRCGGRGNGQQQTNGATCDFDEKTHANATRCTPRFPNLALCGDDFAFSHAFRITS